MSKFPKQVKLNKAVCKAIEKKAVIQFEYHGTIRTIEPQSHGISSGKGLRFSQLDPTRGKK